MLYWYHQQGKQIKEKAFQDNGFLKWRKKNEEKVISVLAAAAMATSMFATPVLADGDVKLVLYGTISQILLSQMPASV